MTAPAGGVLIDSVFYEVSLVSDKMNAGKAKAVAALKQVEDQAKKTGAAVDKIGTGTGLDRAARTDAIIKLNEAFRDGTISQAEYEKQATALGVKLKTLSSASQQAATAFVAQGQAATVAGAATKTAAAQTTVAATATSRLSGILRLFAGGAGLGIITAVAIGLISAAFRVMTGDANGARKRIDEVTEALKRQREEARRASLQGLEDVILDAARAKGAAERELRTAQAGRIEMTGSLGRTGQRTVIDEVAVANATTKLSVATANLTAAQENLRKAEGGVVENRATMLAQLIATGEATRKQAAQAKQIMDQARADLKLLNAETEEGAKRRAEVQGRAPLDPNAVLTEAARLNAIIRNLETAGDKGARALTSRQARIQALTEQLVALKASLTAATDDTLVARIAKIDRQIEELKPSPEQLALLQQLREEIVALSKEQIAKAGESLASQLRVDLASTTITQVDDLTEALKRWEAQIESARAAGTPIDEQLVRQVRAAKEETIALTAQAERLATVLQRIDRETEEEFGFIRNMRSAQEELAQVNAEIAKAEKSGNQKALDAALERRASITQRIKSLQDAITALLAKQKRSTDDLESSTVRVAGAVAQIANSAFGIISAFAGANDELAKMLGGVGQVAGGIEGLFKAARQKDNAGNAIGIGGALTTGAGIGSILQAIGGGIALASSLLGKSPEEQARVERVRENTEALRKLTDRVGTLAQISVPGSSIATASSILNDPGLSDSAINARATRRWAQTPQVDIGALREIERRKALDEAVKRSGLSIEQFNEIMADLGITFGKGRISAEDYETAVNAVNQAAIVKFGLSFAGQMEAFNAALAVFPDLSDPIKQFDAFRRAIENVTAAGKTGAGALGELLKDFDLTTAEGLAAAEAAIQALFERFQAGTLTAADLGALSPAEFIDALLKTLGIIREAGGKTSSGTGSFSSVSTITEATAGRMTAMLSTANIYASQTAQNTAQIVALLGGAPTIQPVSAPPVPGGDDNRQGGNSITVNIENFNVSGSDVTPEAATRFTKHFTAGAVKEMSQALGRDVIWKKHSLGRVDR